MIFAPPGSAKSTYVSVLLIAWYLARYPERSVLAASHTAELAEQWGRRVRSLIAEHGPTLGIELSKDSQAAGRWALKTGGGYFAVGVGGAVVGYRADLIVVDDPVRSRRTPDSKIIRDRTWGWWKSECVTRGKPNCATVLIMTRWNVDDLAGRLLEEQEKTGEPWEIVSLPAEAKEHDALGRKPGAMLWGDDNSGYALALERLKRTTPPRTWSALYEQTPVVEGGNYFQDSWLKPYTQLPPLETLHVYGASDFAVTRDGGDFTCHGLIGIDPSDRMYLLDVWRKRTSAEEWIEAYLDLVARWKPLEWGFESGQIKSAVGPFLERRARERRIYCSAKTFPSRHDKAIRAQAIRGKMALDGLHVPIHAHWYPDFFAELMSFPAGKHDDQVDMLSLLGQMQKHITRRQFPEPPKPIKVLCAPPGRQSLYRNYIGGLVGNP